MKLTSHPSLVPGLRMSGAIGRRQLTHNPSWRAKAGRQSTTDVRALCPRRLVSYPPPEFSPNSVPYM